jgi:glutamate dehydrogenase/leucine dehydrogenase
MSDSERLHLRQERHRPRAHQAPQGGRTASRISEYVTEHPEAEYHEGCCGVWQIPCDIALPCATQNELDEADAKALIKNGCFAVAEGANMPCTPEAIEAFQAAGLLYAPAKASNAGGVATSGLEMSQNSMRFSWSFEEVDDKLATPRTPPRSTAWRAISWRAPTSRASSRWPTPCWPTASYKEAYYE